MKFGARRGEGSTCWLTGTIRNLKVMRGSSSFVITQRGGNRVKGWLWRSPLKEGDQVHVAAQRQNDHYGLVAVRRQEDRTIALYPHCSRGSRAHWRSVTKWWLYISLAFLAALFLLMQGLTSGEAVPVLFKAGILTKLSAGIAAFFALAIFCMARNLLPFVRITKRRLGFSTSGTRPTSIWSSAPKPAASPTIRPNGFVLLPLLIRHVTSALSLDRARHRQNAARQQEALTALIEVGLAS